MKTTYLLSLGVLVGLMTTVAAVVSANDAAPASTVQESAAAEAELLTQLSSPPTFSDSTLRRPF